MKASNIQLLKNPILMIFTSISSLAVHFPNLNLSNQEFLAFTALFSFHFALGVSLRILKDFRMILKRLE